MDAVGFPGSDKVHTSSPTMLLHKIAIRASAKMAIRASPIPAAVAVAAVVYTLAIAPASAVVV